MHSGGDQNMNAAMSSRLILLIFVVLAISGRLNAQISHAETDDYFEFLARVNHYSPLEHAGSHGTLGVGIGVGIASFETPKATSVMEEHWRHANVSPEANQTNSNRVTLTQFHAHKGLPYSLDVGGGYARDARSNAKLVSSYVQWTAYEAFALPALAVRGQFSRLMGLSTTDASTLETSVLASYGFLRLFTTYASYGIGRHDVLVRIGPSFGTSMSLAGETDGNVGRIMIRRSRSVGIQYQLLPPFCTMAAEYSQVGQSPGSYLAKISVGI